MCKSLIILNVGETFSLKNKNFRMIYFQAKITLFVKNPKFSLSIKLYLYMPLVNVTMSVTARKTM